MLYASFIRVAIASMGLWSSSFIGRFARFFRLRIILPDLFTSIRFLCSFSAAQRRHPRQLVRKTQFHVRAGRTVERRRKFHLKDFGAVNSASRSFDGHAQFDRALNAANGSERASAASFAAWPQRHAVPHIT